ncbi:MAG: hypothetical protein COB67_01300 [SAR324 cluster bacterium]|uniref:Porin domain-containing protein n=1 Tax=SAR324 cluster bacterium TaxID=2024889 RepID=A0A2A4TBV1_9DELT|nr:MAG: hypothetical protein COB67_01300 [SAR324 cluster bacterium]
MKTALTVAAVAGMSTAAMAAPNFSGSIKSYYGQVDTGAKNSSTYQKSLTEANLFITGAQGNMSYVYELEQRDNKAGADGGRKYITYTMDALSFQMGTNIVGVPFSLVSGTKTSSLAAYGIFSALNVYNQSDGLGINYKISDAMSAGIVLFDSDASGNGSSVANAEGSATAISFNGTFGPLAVKVLSQAGTEDNFASSTDTTLKSAKTLIGAKFTISDQMSISLDITSKEKDNGSKKDSAADTAIQFKMKDLGPGNLTVTYATSEKKELDETTQKDVFTALVYDISVEKGAGIQIVYASDATDMEAASADDTTKTFIGVGFYTAF